MKKILCFISLFLMMTTVGCSAVNNSSSQKTIAAASAVQQIPNKIKQPERFAQIDMVTADSGYAITKQFHVLKTSDGGSSWNDVFTINSLFSYSDEPALFALNAKIVMIAFYTTSGIEMEKSIDSGKHWFQYVIKMDTNDFDTGYGGSLALSFTNQSDGFLLTSTFPAAGLMGKALYKTTDGGVNWSFVGKNSNSEQESGTLTGVDGYTTGLTFSGTGTGYITCTYHGQNKISVYKTVNSGKSWFVVPLPVPTKYLTLVYDHDYYVDAYPPASCGKNKKSIKMELNFCRGEERQAYIYSSEDGGSTWLIDGISNLLVKKYCFVNDKDGFGLDENGTIYTSSDGGISWFSTSK
jgi:photosystem II stability/assembly factor-like uncharacterized protein